MSEADDQALDAAVLAANQQAPEPTAEPAPGQPVDAHGHPAGDNDGTIVGYDDGPAGDDAAAYDPSAHSVKDVNAYLLNAGDAERQRVLDLEADGKNRKGIVESPHQPGEVKSPGEDDEDGPELVRFDDDRAPREALPGELQRAELAPTERTAEGEGVYDELAKRAPRETVED